MMAFAFTLTVPNTYRLSSRKRMFVFPSRVDGRAEAEEMALSHIGAGEEEEEEEGTRSEGRASG